VVLALAMWPAWTATDRMVTGGDAVAIHFPWFVLWRDLLAAGEWPFWNPYSFSGMPAFATLQAGFGYPLHWLLTPLPPILAMNWLVGLHVLLAGLGAAWCAGRLGATRDGQLLAGLTYALGSAMTARMWSGHFSFVETNAWLPLATGLAIGVGRRHAVTLLALVVGMLALAGQPEILVFSLWWLPLWAVGAAFLRGERRPVRELARVVVGVSLGVGLAAFQLLPVLDLLASSNRQPGSMGWDFRTGASLPPWHLLELFAPLLFGSPAPVTYWAGPNHEWHERLLWVGIVPLLAAGALRGRWRWLCWGGALVAVLLAFGRYTPLYALAQALPGYASLRIPSKHLALAALALSLAAGVGLPLLRGRRPALVALSLAGGLGLLALTMDWWLPAALLLGGRDGLSERQPQTYAALAGAGAVPGLLVLVLAAPIMLVARTRLRHALLVGLAAAELLLVLQPFRMRAEDPLRTVADVRLPDGYASVGLLGSYDAIIANYGPVMRVRMPGGYLSLFSGGYMELLTGGSNPGVVLTAPADSGPILNLLGYPVLLNRDEGRLTVFAPPPPQVWVARCVWAGTIQDVRKADFPRASCITRAAARGRPAPVPAGPAEIVGQGAGWLTVRASGPGWLVTTHPWYPGWTATANGQALNVEAVDGALVGVELPDGEHVVSVRYWPSGLTSGLLISGGVAMVLALSWLLDRRHSRRRAGLPGPSTVLHEVIVTTPRGGC